MNKAYVSDFEILMEKFLKDHPEVVEEQRRGWSSFWEVKVDPAATKFSSEDIVPDDHYGFKWQSMRRSNPVIQSPRPN